MQNNIGGRCRRVIIAGVLVVGVAVVLVVLLLNAIRVSLKQVLQENNLLKQELKTYHDLGKTDKLYADPEGRFFVRVPWGYTVEQTESWAAVAPEWAVRIEDKILIEYEGGLAAGGKKLADAVIERNKEVFALSISSESSSSITQPVVTEVKLDGSRKVAVLESCDRVKVLGGGYTCTASAMDKAYLQRLYVQDGTGTVVKLTLLTDSPKMKMVDLREWIDRVQIKK